MFVVTSMRVAIFEELKSLLHGISSNQCVIDTNYNYYCELFSFEGNG